MSMRAMRRARISEGGRLRATSSNCSQRVARGLPKRAPTVDPAGRERSGQLHGGSPSVAPTQWIGRESVDEMAQLEQIGKTTERNEAPCRRRANSRAAGVTICPSRSTGLERASGCHPAADKQEEHTAAPDAADHDERAALKGVTLAGDRHRIGKITAMGSLPTPSFDTIPHDRLISRVAGSISDGRHPGLIEGLLSFRMSCAQEPLDQGQGCARR